MPLIVWWDYPIEFLEVKLESILLPWSEPPPLGLRSSLASSFVQCGQGLSSSTVWECKQADFTIRWHQDLARCAKVSLLTVLSSWASLGSWEPAAVRKKPPELLSCPPVYSQLSQQHSHHQPGFPTIVLAREASLRGVYLFLPRERYVEENALSVSMGFLWYLPFPGSHVCLKNSFLFLCWGGRVDHVIMPDI